MRAEPVTQQEKWNGEMMGVEIKSVQSSFHHSNIPPFQNNLFSISVVRV
jgi:hypothetical protein